jgi:GNAT superfamily N-acetyltransferase
VILKWRLATENDFSAINAIALQIHPQLPERPDVMAEKQRLFPEGCLVLASGLIISGYVLSHPWKCNKIPALNELLWQLPKNPDCLYLHDIALLPNARGHRASRQLVETLIEIAYKEKLSFLALTSVYDTRGLWESYGFKPYKNIHIDHQINTYGPTATYMIKSLQGLDQPHAEASLS